MYTILFLQISSHCAILEAGRDFSHFSHSLRWVMKNWTIDSSNHVHWLGNCLASTALGASRRTIRLPLGSNITLLAFRKYRTLIQKKVTLLQKRTKYMYRLVSLLCCLLNLFAKQNKLNPHKVCFEVHSGTNVKKPFLWSPNEFQTNENVGISVTIRNTFVATAVSWLTKHSMDILLIVVQVSFNIKKLFYDELIKIRPYFSFLWWQSKSRVVLTLSFQLVWTKTMLSIF